MAEFIEPLTSKLKVKVTIGNSVKIITIKGFNAKGTVNDAIAVLDAVLVEIGGSSYDVLSLRKISVWNVDTGEWQEIIFTASDISLVFSNSYQTQGNVFSANDFNGTYLPSGNKFSANDVATVFQPDYQLSY